MAKLIELEEAAALLGMTPDEVTEARTKNQLFGYRDGVNWKFKESELERYAASQGILLGSPEPKRPSSSGSLPKLASVDEELSEMIEVSELKLSDADDDQDSSDPDSILVSEEELGSSEPGAGSTIIGKEQLGDDADLILSGDSTGGSDIVLSSDSGGASDLLAEGSEIKLSEGSEIKLADASDLTLSEGSEIKLADDSEIKLTDSSGAGSELRLAGDSVASNIMADDEVLNAGSGTGDLILDVEDGLELSDDELILDDDSISSIDIEGAEDDEGNLHDSDITLNASDSGINLTSPSDSGLSLEKTPAELGGSGIEALELGEADFIELDDEDELDLDEGTELKADDDFLLTSAEGGVSDESESGSQVIALDEADEFDEVGDTMLAETEMLDAGDLATTDAVKGGAVDIVPGAAPQTIPAPVDDEYSIWNVAGLGTCLFFLSLAGIMMFDLLRNMWSWQQEYSLNSSLMEAIINLLPG